MLSSIGQEHSNFSISTHATVLRERSDKYVVDCDSGEPCNALSRPKATHVHFDCDSGDAVSHSRPPHSAPGCDSSEVVVNHSQPPHVVFDCDSSGDVVGAAVGHSSTYGKLMSTLEQEFCLSLQQFSKEWLARQQTILKQFVKADENPVRNGAPEASRTHFLSELSAPHSRTHHVSELSAPQENFARRPSVWSNLSHKRKQWLEGAGSCAATLGWQRQVKVLHAKSQRTVHGFSRHTLGYRGTVNKCLKSDWYGVLYSAIVMLDVFGAFWDGEYASQAVWNEVPQSAIEIEESTANMILADICCAYFILDVGFRIYARRCAFFTKSSSLAFFQIFSTIACSVDAVVQHSGVGSTSWVRAATHQLALIRILRCIEFVLHSKMNYMTSSSIFQDVRLLFYSVSTSLATALSAVVVILYSCMFSGMIFAQGYVHLFRRGFDISEDEMAQLKHAFGTPGRSMLSLYKSAFGAYDWDDLYVVVQSLGWGYQVAFLVFQLFVFIVLFNVVNAVFVDRTFEKSKHDRRYMAHTAYKSSQDFLRSMQALFAKLDANKSGTIDKEKFKKGLEDRKHGAYFHSMGIDTNNADHLFKILDSNGSGTVDEEEFMFGCMKIKGEARNLDIAIMQRFMKLMHHDMCEGFKLIFTNTEVRGGSSQGSVGQQPSGISAGSSHPRLLELQPSTLDTFASDIDKVKL